MKLNPAVIVLSLIFALTFAFMWGIYPDKEVMSEDTVPKLQTVDFEALADGWNKSPSFLVSFNALDPSYEVSTTANSLFDPLDEYFGLPRDEQGSFELVEAYCTACHSLSIVMQQKASPERWDELLDWMEKEQGMAPLPVEDDKLVLAYVSKYFSTK